MKGILALYQAQAKAFLRDRGTVFAVLLLPISFGVFFGLIFSGGGGTVLQLGIVNEDTGTEGTAFTTRLQTPEYEQGFSVRLGQRDELVSALNEGDLSAVIVLPDNLSAALAERRPVPVEVLYDPNRATSAGALGVVRTLLDDANLRFSDAPRLLEMQAQTVQTDPLRSVEFYLPGMLGVALLWLGIFGTANPVVAQREAQIPRRLSLTAVTRTTMLASEVGWRVSVGILQTAIFLVVGYFGFRVGVQTWLPFIGTILLGTLMFVCLGYVIAGIARTTESAAAIGQVISFPMMMLSGSIMSAEFLPAAFKPVLVVMPLTYLSDLLRQTMVGAAPLHSMGLDFAVLTGWLVVMLGLAIRLWRWE